MEYATQLFNILKDSPLKRKLAFYIIKFDKYANLENVNESIKIDTWELESLINPDKFRFDKEEVGIINVEKD